MTLNHLYHLMSEEIVAVLVDVDDDDEADIDAKFVCSQTPFWIDFCYIRISKLMMLIKLVMFVLFFEITAQHRYANSTFKN